MTIIYGMHAQPINWLKAQTISRQERSSNGG